EAIFGNVPLILNLEEGRKGQQRATLKCVIYEAKGGKRSFQDIFVKGPWRRRVEEAKKDQEEMSTAFKYEGKAGLDKKIVELEDKEWRTEDLEPEKPAGAAAAE
ncbi:unnamed protein product, partial [Prorocentrum cordatum]